MLLAAQLRRDFPILREMIGGHPLIYLDNAATTQKPRQVLEAMQSFYETDNANVHRGMHVLAERATVAYQQARDAVRTFLNAASPGEIVFTKSCTESINLVAKSWARSHMQRGDAVILSLLEHHSNIVPWLQLKEEMGIDVRWIEIDDEGRLQLETLDRELARGSVKLVAVTGQSNVLGVRPPLEEIIEKAHAAGAKVLVDAAQLVGHHPIDVQTLDCDFLAFSGHKVFGPTGIGVLYGKKELLDAMPPFLGGGMMIREVHRDRFTAAETPAKFEAGTPPVAEAVGLHAALEWLGQCSWSDREAHEDTVMRHAIETLGTVEGVTILGPRNCEEISGCISFTLDGIHPHDLTEILGREGLCLRAGHHCTQPLHRRLGIAASTRLSVALYNTKEEIDTLADGILQAQKILGAVSKT